MFRIHPVAKLFLVSLIVAIISACARLPEYARPRMVEPGEAQMGAPAFFRYRALTAEDFRATSPSGQLSGHAEKINAHAAIQIRLAPESSFRITPGVLYGQVHFFGRVERLGFEAVMLPDRSWWNPDLPSSQHAYVLQHEQIHFALTEIAARHLTRESRDWAPELLAIKRTQQEVREELSRQIKERIDAALETSLKRQLQFDEETSLFHNPRRQEWWLRMVTEELKEVSY
ncbi:MAG: hypothetical protein R6V84_03345 [Desulfobacterales bacterium]